MTKKINLSSADLLIIVRQQLVVRLGMFTGRALLWCLRTFKNVTPVDTMPIHFCLLFKELFVLDVAVSLFPMPNDSMNFLLYKFYESKKFYLQNM
jgi:hypothetical protein